MIRRGHVIAAVIAVAVGLFAAFVAGGFILTVASGTARPEAFDPLALGVHIAIFAAVAVVVFREMRDKFAPDED